MDSNAFNANRDLDRVLAEARQMRANVVAPFVQRGVARLAAVLGPLMAPLRQWHARAKLDLELRSLSDYELHDIGLVRSDIDAVVKGRYRDERAAKAGRRPILVSLDGIRRIRAEIIKVDPKKAA